MFKLTHMLNSFNASVQCLTLLYQITGGDDDNECDSTRERFYAALYKKLADPRMASASAAKMTLLLNLLFKSMKKDHSKERVTAFAKRLLQVCTTLPSEIVCGILFLVSEVIRSRSDIVAISKGASNFQSAISKIEDDYDDSGDEHYDDVKDSDDDDNDAEVKVEVKATSWIHKDNRKVKSGSKNTGYDPFGRNPAHCGAANVDLASELDLLSRHAHPTVSLFAKNVMDGARIKYDGDPLQDFTLVRFLDRFVFRNPKKDPLKGKPTSVLSKRKNYVPKGVRGMAPDSKEYANVAESAIPLEERFIFKYFAQKRQNAQEQDDDDNDSVTSEDFGAFMDGYFKQKGSKEDKDDLDFAGNVGELKDDDEEDDDDGDLELDDDDDNDDESEPELEGEGDDGADFLEDIGDVDDDDDDEFDEENYALSDNDEDDMEEQPASAKRKRKGTKDSLPDKKGKRKKHGDLHDLLASAEEFADVVEQAVADDVDLGGVGAVSNVKDKAGKKQLVWERERGGEKRGKRFNNKKRRK